MTSWLASLLAAVHLLPEHLARLFGQSQKAWEYVAYGFEAAILWLIVGSMTRTIGVQMVAAWGAAEGGMRGICRLTLPMDHAPNMSAGQNLCDAVTVLPASWVSLAAVLLVACVAQEEGGHVYAGTR